MIPRPQTRAQAKARARHIKANSLTPINFSMALEQVAAELGFRDWNTASARLSNEPETTWQIGDRVCGRYLKKPFEGRVHAVRELQGGQGYELTLHFDTPVDVVDWKSFSAFRQRVKMLVSAQGQSWNKTSDGAPHLVVERIGAFAI